MYPSTLCPVSLSFAKSLSLSASNFQIPSLEVGTILQHISKLTIILLQASSALPGIILLKIIISPHPFLILLHYFLVICDPSHCFLGLNLNINHIIIYFTIFSNKNILSECCLIVLLVCLGPWCGFLCLLFLSPTLRVVRVVFWHLFNPFCCWFSIILFIILTSGLT